MTFDEYASGSQPRSLGHEDNISGDEITEPASKSNEDPIVSVESLALYLCQQKSSPGRYVVPLENMKRLF